MSRTLSERRKRSVPILIAAFWLVASLAAAQTPVTVRGTVLDPAGNPVAGARVAFETGRQALTDADGRFAIEVQPGQRSLRISRPGFATSLHPLTVGRDPTDLEFHLALAPAVDEAVTVVGIRAGEDVPVTQRNLDREEIEAGSYGQDVPSLLQFTPAMTWYSDSGGGSGYSYFSLRGIQQSRINMTFDGAPLNDPAEHALYFNNFHDFTQAVDSIQIQRGVGTSSVGSPAYGGSVNFASSPPATEPGGRFRLVGGSYDTVRASVSYDSGLFDNGAFVSGRYSYSDTDGYRDRSGSTHGTFFLNSGWEGERSSLKFVSFSGNEDSQLAYLAVDPETLRADRRFNPLTAEDRDSFGQDFAQLRYTRVAGDDTLFSASVYYNGADGWFRIWDDPLAQTDLLQFGIDQAVVGTMLTAVNTGERLSTTLGVHYNDFSGDHTLDAAGGRAYLNTGKKQTANAFAKLEYRLDRWLLYGDLQLRWAEFSYAGDIDLGSVDWTFVDPKVGLRRELSPELSVYGSIGRAQREPGRLDMLAGEDNASVAHDLGSVRPEEVNDLELGVNLNTPRLALQANVYAMEFENEIALTGELSEIGLPLRRNVDDSYRRGVEIDLKWLVTAQWSVLHSANLSRNRIDEWKQFYDVYDSAGTWVDSVPLTYTGVKPVLTPELVLNLGAEWHRPGTRVLLLARHVGESQLDNTGLAEFVLPSYTNLDLRAAWDLGRGRAPEQRPRLTVFVNNLLDDDGQFPGGYSYQFINRDDSGADSLDGSPYYYPQATRNLVVSLSFGF